MGQDAYYVDGEFGLLDLTFHYGITRRSSVYVTLSAYNFTGGFLDARKFHDTFGLDTGGRDLAERDRFQGVLSVEGVRTSFLAPPIDGGLGDPVIGVRHIWPLAGTRWGWSSTARPRWPGAASGRFSPPERTITACRRRCRGLYASESTVRDTTIDQLKADKYQASFGLRSHRGHLVYGFAVTENVANFANTPDIGVSMTLAWVALRP